MSRLPIPGSDINVWGDILNDYLQVSHNNDGTVKTEALVRAGAVTSVNAVGPDVNGNVLLMPTPTTLAGQADVSLSAPTNSQVLAYDSSTGKWVNQTSGAGLSLDSNASDIQPLGTPAAGSTGKAADAGHVHSTAGMQTVIEPSGDSTGATDNARIQAALNSYTNVCLAAGTFYITGLTVPVQSTAGTSGGQGSSISGAGPATLVYLVGSGTGIYMHRTSNYGVQFGLPAQKTAGFIRDLVLDGTYATGSAVGVDIGDGWGYETDLTIANFTGSSQTALWIVNRVTWTEKCRFRANLLNNQNPVILDTAISDVSHEYCELDFYMFCNASQNGVVVRNGVNLGGCLVRISGNMSLTNTDFPGGGTTSTNGTLAMLTITGNSGSTYSKIYASLIAIKVEGNAGNGTGTAYPWGILLGSSSNAIRESHGMIVLSLGQESNLNGGEFTFRGLISGDPTLSVPTTPSVPASLSVVENLGPDTQVCIHGGTVTAVAINGVSTGLTSGAFFLAAGATIQLTYSAAPSWVWVPAAESQY